MKKLASVQKIELENVTEIKSYCDYVGCAIFVIGNINDTIINTTFYNYSFRGDLFDIYNILNCEFKNCTFNCDFNIGNMNAKIENCRFNIVNYYGSCFKDEKKGLKNILEIFKLTLIRLQLNLFENEIPNMDNQINTTKNFQFFAMEKIENSFNEISKLEKLEILHYSGHKKITVVDNSNQIEIPKKLEKSIKISKITHISP